jgi:MerR family transcriptional regulator/heat shock protein HspR
MAPLAFDDEHAPLYTVGQVAGMLDVQPAFLRRLDVEQVVQPARSDGGQRRYSRNEIALVQHVSQMADAGMSLAGIRRILVLEAEVAALRRQLAELKEKAATPR